MTDLITKLKATKVVPVIALHNVEDAIPLAEAAMAGGCQVLELTLRTEAGLPALKAIKKAYPDLAVGMGTVFTPDAVKSTVDAGADFIVTPGTTMKTAEALINCGIPGMPGFHTVSEALTLSEMGFKILKFFPAETNGGVPALKGIAGPLPHLTIMPTGGINRGNVKDYLALPSVIAVGGSFITDKASLANKDWAQITANAKFAAGL